MGSPAERLGRTIGKCFPGAGRYREAVNRVSTVCVRGWSQGFRNGRLAGWKDPLTQTAR